LIGWKWAQCDEEAFQVRMQKKEKEYIQASKQPDRLEKQQREVHRNGMQSLLE
jgi:hypothetical protein